LGDVGKQFLRIKKSSNQAENQQFRKKMRKMGISDAIPAHAIPTHAGEKLVGRPSSS